MAVGRELTVTTNQGDITILAGATTGSINVLTGNGEDPYVDPSSVTATISGTSGGNFVKLSVTGTTATPPVTDTIYTTTLALSTSDVQENVDHVTFTATVSNAAGTDLTVHTNHREIPHPSPTRRSSNLVLTGNGEDPYVDPSSVTATISGTSGGN